MEYSRKDSRHSKTRVVPPKNGVLIEESENDYSMLNEFNPSTQIKLGDKILISGASGYGKSRLMKQLMRELKDTIDDWVIFNPIESANHMYGSHVTCEETIVKLSYENIAEDLINKIKSIIKRVESNPPNHCTGIIIDEFSTQRKVWKSHEFKWLMTACHAYGIIPFVLVQFRCEIPKLLRECFTKNVVFPNNRELDLVRKDCDLHWLFAHPLEEIVNQKSKIEGKTRSIWIVDNDDYDIRQVFFSYHHTFQQPEFKVNHKYCTVDKTKQTSNNQEEVYWVHHRKFLHESIKFDFVTRDWNDCVKKIESVIDNHYSETNGSVPFRIILENNSSKEFVVVTKKSFAERLLEWGPDKWTTLTYEHNEFCVSSVTKVK